MTSTPSNVRHTAKDPFVESMAVLREILAKKQPRPPVSSSPRGPSEAQYELQLAKLQQELAEERSKVIKLQQQVENVAADLDTATARQHELQMELNYAHEGSQEKERQIASVQTELDEVRELNSSLQEQFISSEQESQSMIEGLQDRVSDTEREIEALSQQLESIEQENQSKIEALQDRVADMKQERVILSQQLAELKHSYEKERELREKLETDAKAKTVTENQVVKQTNESSALLLSQLSRIEEEYNLAPEEGAAEDDAISQEDDVVSGNDEGEAEVKDDEGPKDEEDGDNLQDQDEGAVEEGSSNAKEDTAGLTSNDAQGEYYTQSEINTEIQETRSEQQNDFQEMEATGEEGEDEEMVDAEVASENSDMIERNDEGLEDAESNGASPESEQGENESDDDDDDDDDDDVEEVEMHDDASSSKRSRSDEETDDGEVEVISVNNDSSAESDEDEPERKRNRPDYDEAGDSV